MLCLYLKIIKAPLLLSNFINLHPFKYHPSSFHYEALHDLLLNLSDQKRAKLVVLLVLH